MYTENAQEIRTIRINGYDCIFVLKDARISLMWIDEESEKVFILVAHGLSEKEASDIVAHFTNRLEASKSLPNT